MFRRLFFWHSSKWFLIKKNYIQKLWHSFRRNYCVLFHTSQLIIFTGDKLPQQLDLPKIQYYYRIFNQDYASHYGLNAPMNRMSRLFNRVDSDTCRSENRNKIRSLVKLLQMNPSHGCFYIAMCCTNCLHIVKIAGNLSFLLL